MKENKIQMPVKNNNRADRGKNKKAGNAPKLSAEQERKNLAKLLGLRPKTKEFVDLMQANPKLSATEAWIRTHETVNRNSARATASKVLAKPNVIGYKDSAVKKAKNRVVSLIDSANDNTALKAAQDVIDRNEGKSVQKTENTSRVVTIALDLSGLRMGAHYVKPELLQPPAE